MRAARGTVKQIKRLPGRPKIGKQEGETPLVAFRPPGDLLAALDAYAKRHKIGRSEAIRRILAEHLLRT